MYILFTLFYVFYKSTITDLMKSLAIVALLSVFFSFDQVGLSPAEVVDVQLEAYNSRDIDAFVATYSDQFQAFEYGHEMPFLEGKAALRASYGAMFQTSPNLNAYSKNRIVQGNRVIDHEIAEGINDGPAIQVVVIYEVNEGLIEKVTFMY